AAPCPARGRTTGSRRGRGGGRVRRWRPLSGEGARGSTSRSRSGSARRGGDDRRAGEDAAGPIPHRLDRTLADVADRLQRVTVQIRGPYGAMGSGVIWAAAGLILTNAHVVRGPSAVVLSTGQRFDARLLARDP